MVSSSQATTASADASGDETLLHCDSSAPGPAMKTPDYKSPQHEKHTKIEAIVRWNQDGQLHEQTDLLFDLQYHALYNTAFFKLRASISLKNGSALEQVPLFLFLAPEIIRTLSLSSHHGQALGADTICLSFGLKGGDLGAPQLVVPGSLDPIHLTGKNKRSNDIWDSLRSLTRATSLDVVCRLPRRVMSEARLQSLCSALSGGLVKSTPGHAELGGLYGGKGGRAVLVETKLHNDPPEEALPAYQELEPGPPMAPLLPDKPSNKRRRGNSDTEERTSFQPAGGLEATVAWLVTELQEHKVREASLVSELKQVKAQVAMLISQEEQHRSKCKLLDDEMKDRVSAAEAKLDELDDELEIRVECKIDETLDQKSDSIKEELVAYIDDNLPSRIQGALEEVTFSARF